MLAPRRVADYLGRLDLTMGEASLDGEGLARLQDAHLHRIPFENLAIHLGEPIVLEPEALVAKIVDRSRGGFCFEMNGAFAALLDSLGFDVTLMEGRVYGPDGAPGIPFDHLCLRVDLDDPYLVDVGFGASAARPLRLDVAGPQADPNGSFEIRPCADDDGWSDLVHDGRPVFRFSPVAHDLEDFEGACLHHQTSPESHFTKNSLCTRATDDGRVTIAGRLLITRSGADRTERTVDDDAELLALYREHFGVTLDRVPPR